MGVLLSQWPDRAGDGPVADRQAGPAHAGDSAEIRAPAGRDRRGWRPVTPFQARLPEPSVQNEPAQETAFRAAGFPLPGGEVLAHRTPFHPKRWSAAPAPA